MSKAFVYSLNNPITNEPNYVGRTISPKSRLHSHVSLSRHGKTKVSKWICELIQNGQFPVMEILEECEEEDVSHREVFWIYKLSSSNILLNNIKYAGFGGKGIAGMSRINVSMPEEMINLIDEQIDDSTCKSLGRSKIVRQAINDWLIKQQNKNSSLTEAQAARRALDEKRQNINTGENKNA